MNSCSYWTAKTSEVKYDIEKCIPCVLIKLTFFAEIYGTSIRYCMKQLYLRKYFYKISRIKVRIDVHVAGNKIRSLHFSSYICLVHVFYVVRFNWGFSSLTTIKALYLFHPKQILSLKFMRNKKATTTIEWITKKQLSQKYSSGLAHTNVTYSFGVAMIQISPEKTLDSLWHYEEPANRYPEKQVFLSRFSSYLQQCNQRKRATVMKL